MTDAHPAEDAPTLRARLERTLLRQPGDRRALLALARLHREQQRMEAAWEMLRRADAAPREIDGAERQALAREWALWGERTGQAAPGDTRAEEALRRAVALMPGHFAFRAALAAWLARCGRHQDSLAEYRAAAAAEPAIADMLNNLGVSFEASGRREDAFAVLKAGTLVAPDNAALHDNLGNALLGLGQPREAETAHRRAMALGAAGANSWNNLGNALHRQGRLKEAEAAYRAAIARAPQVAKFHANLALTLLLDGAFAEGWREYEWRWRDRTDLPAFLEQRKWRGEPLDAALPAGGTLLLVAEQGYGDTVQFIRYVPWLRQRAQRLVLCCQPELVRLMESVSGLDQVCPEGAPLPAFDRAVTLMSLPGLAGTDETTIPAPIPYLSAPAGTFPPGADNGPHQGLKVGLAWAGRPTHGDDWNRSIPARELAPLLAVPGVTFFGLQKGAVAERLGRPPEDQVVPVADLCADFADTAALIAQLDLVIAVDTAVVHVAGALGRPVWVLLPPVPDFRWRMDGDRSPWYPSARLYRKTAADGWAPLIHTLARDLRALTA